MKLFKSIQTNAAPTDNIDNSTSRYTRPLILKVVGTFAVVFGLLIIFTIFALFNLNQGKDTTHNALALQTKANDYQFLRSAIVNERVSILNTLYTGMPDPNLAKYQNDFDAEQRDLIVDQDTDIYALANAHTEFRNNYNAIITIFMQGNANQARQMWLAADAQAQNLINQVDQRLNTVNTDAFNASTKADQVENDAAGSTLWLAVICFFMMAGLIYFAVSSVIGPLRLLNQNLSQLLWTQTEHLTDQLNMAQADINVNNDMLTTVRHDLKSPLSSIKGLAELSTILQPNLEADVKANLDKIVEMADTSVTTISDVLTRREQKLDLQTVQVDQLVDKVLQLVDLRYYHVQRSVETESWVMDRGLMEHALLNLVSNARKFSDRGLGVGVRKVRKAGTVDTEELELWVWNDGAVITAEDRNEVFKPGKQTAEGKKAGGHGLGLYIVKSIAERHHGRVAVESHEKIGTTFRIYIPKLEIDKDKAGGKPNLSVTEKVDDPSHLLNAF